MSRQGNLARLSIGKSAKAGTSSADSHTIALRRREQYKACGLKHWDRRRSLFPIDRGFRVLMGDAHCNIWFRCLPFCEQDFGEVALLRRAGPLWW